MINGLFVDLGYSNPTKMALIKNDALVEVMILDPKTEMMDVVDVTVKLLIKYKLGFNEVKDSKNPMFTAILKEELKRKGINA